MENGGFNMKIVAFVGPKGSGKDTCADILINNKKAISKLSFAGPLKEICCKVFGLTQDQVNLPELKDKELDNPVVLNKRNLRLLKSELIKYVSEVQQGVYIYNIDRITISDFEGRVYKTPREVLQQIGAEFIRAKVHPHWHILAAFGDNVLKRLDKEGTYCVTDVRFENELEFLRDKFKDNLKSFYINRQESEDKLSNAKHSSEVTVSELRKMVDSEINNNGDIKSLTEMLVPSVSSKKGKKRGKSRKKS